MATTTNPNKKLVELTAPVLAGSAIGWKVGGPIGGIVGGIFGYVFGQFITKQ